MQHRKPASLTAVALVLTSSIAAAQFQPATNVPAPTDPDWVAAADFNGDSFTDMAVPTDAPDKVSVFFNTGSGTFGAPANVLLAGGTGPQAAAAMNVDGDADVDLVVTLKNINSVQVLLNNGSGGFSLGGVSPVGLDPRHIAFGDLDNDADLDVVTSNRGGASVSVLLNNGAGVFGPAVPYTVGLEPRAVVVADFNGDTLLDIAVASNDDRRVDVLTNSGAGVFGPPTSWTLGPNLRPDGLAAADLDADGDMDFVASANGGALEVASVFLNVGGSFTGPTNYGVGGLDPSSIFASDFDLDGRVDLATANSTSSDVSILINSGGGVFGAPTLFPVGTDPQFVTGADLNGDLSTDLMVPNAVTNDVSVLLNQNARVENYCVGKLNSQGCVPFITFAGVPSASSTGPFNIRMNDAVPSEAGFILYGSKKANLSFHGGRLCVKAPFQRLLPPKAAKNTGTPPCSGVLTRNFNARIQSGADPALTAGGVVFGQWFQRDPLDPAGFGDSLSDGLRFVIAP